jgi:hypothetical protein
MVEPQMDRRLTTTASTTTSARMDPNTMTITNEATLQIGYLHSLIDSIVPYYHSNMPTHAFEIEINDN